MTNAARRAPPRLLDRVSFLVHRINAHMLRQTNPLLKEWGIDLTESRLMVAILEMGAMSAGDIVRIMALPQSTVSHQLKRLEKLGYLSRTPSEKDSRVIIAALTSKGRQVASHANEHSQRVMSGIADAIGSDEELELVRAAMKRVDEALQTKD